MYSPIHQHILLLSGARIFLYWQVRKIKKKTQPHQERHLWCHLLRDRVSFCPDKAKIYLISCKQRLQRCLLAAQSRALQSPLPFRSKKKKKSLTGSKGSFLCRLMKPSAMKFAVSCRIMKVKISFYSLLTKQHTLYFALQTANYMIHDELLYIAVSFYSV